MGVHKGTDNFKGYRMEQMTELSDLLKSVFDELKQSKAIYPSWPDFVRVVAKRVNKHRTTLTRSNSKYLPLLLKHFGEQPGAIGLVDDKHATSALLRAKLIEAQLEVEDLKRRKTKSRAPAELDSVQAVDRVLARDYADSIWAIRMLLDHVNADGEVLHVDHKAGAILDLSFPHGKQAVVGGPRLKAALEALKRLDEKDQAAEV